MDEKQKKLLIIWAAGLLPVLIIAIAFAVFLSKPKGFGEGESSTSSSAEQTQVSGGETTTPSPISPEGGVGSPPPSQPSPMPSAGETFPSPPPGPTEGMMPQPGGLPLPAPQPQPMQAAPGEKLQEPGYKGRSDPFSPVHQPKRISVERPSYALLLPPALPPEEKPQKRIQWDSVGIPMLNVDIMPTGVEYWTAEGRRNLRGKRPEKEERAHEPLEAPYRMAGILIDSQRVHAILEANERDHGVLRAGDSLQLSVLPAPGLERSEVKVVRIERDRMLVEDVDGQLKYVKMRPAGARAVTGVLGTGQPTTPPMGGEMPQPWMQQPEQPWMQPMPPGGMPQPWMQPMPPGGMPQPWMQPMPPGGMPQPWMQPGAQQPGFAPGARPGQSGGRRPFIRRPQQPRPEE